MKRVESHRIRPSSPYYKMLREFCHLSKNLYNHANYLIRQAFTDKKEYLSYAKVDKLLKADTEYPDYRAMPSAQAAQQTLRLLDKNWISFFAANRDSATLPDNGRYASIDIGVNNLAAVATNTEAGTFLVKGTPLKAMNQFYNKKLAKKKSVCERMNGRHSSQRIAQLTGKRNRKVSDYLHKASRSVVDWCTENQITSLIIGQNKGWKQEVELGKKMNQHFVQIPFANFIQMLQYKAADAGIKVIMTEESYTSGTSFLDDELPAKDFYNKKRRVHRGLFVANDGRKINADINGAFQIMKKVFPNVYADGIEGAVSRPAVVAL